jgi:(p)ppGpp synthase/HD superfamily hydrolase
VSSSVETPSLSVDDRGRIVTALEFALAHHVQCRDSRIEACSAHLLAVAGQALELGGGGTLTTAALLHDIFEHCPDVTRQIVREKFGDEVLGIVEDLTVPLPTEMPDADWRARRQAWLDRLRDVGQDSILLAACERRHRLATILGEMRVRSPGVPRPDTARDLVWFNRQFLERVRGRLPQRLWIDLEDLVLRFESAVALQYPAA